MTKDISELPMVNAKFNFHSHPGHIMTATIRTKNTKIKSYDFKDGETYYIPLEIAEIVGKETRRYDGVLYYSCMTWEGSESEIEHKNVMILSEKKN